MQHLGSCHSQAHRSALLSPYRHAHVQFLCRSSNKFVLSHSCNPPLHAMRLGETHVQMHGLCNNALHKFAVLLLLQEAAAVTRSQVAQNEVQQHTVSVSLLSDSDDEHRPDSGQEAISHSSVHVHLRVHQPASEEEQLQSQLRQQQQLAQALGGRVAQLEAELGAREAHRAALMAEVALLRTQAAKAEQRIGVLEREVAALMQQAEQSSYEHALAQQVQHAAFVFAASLKVHGGVSSLQDASAHHSQQMHGLYTED